MSHHERATDGKRKLRFLSRESYLRDYALAGFGSQFHDKAAFDAFYEPLSEEKKDEFLRVASLYLFLVKQGDWQVEVDGSAPIILKSPRISEPVRSRGWGTV